MMFLLYEYLSSRNKQLSIITDCRWTIFFDLALLYVVRNIQSLKQDTKAGH